MSPGAAAASLHEGNADIAHSSRRFLYWIPLGAGGRCVRFSGRVFEALQAARQHRQRCDLYHAALVVELDGEGYTIELAPSPDADTSSRGAGGYWPRREPLRRLVAPVSLRGPLLSRRVHSRFRRGGRRTVPADQRPRRRPPAARPRRGRARARVGTRRAEGGRDVELELDDRLADRQRGALDRSASPATARSRPGLGRRPRWRLAAAAFTQPIDPSSTPPG